MAINQRVVTLAIGATLVFSSLAVGPAYADSSAEIQNKIDSIHNQQTEKKQHVADQKKTLKNVQSKEEQKKAELQKVQAQISDTEDKISAKKSDIADTKAKIDLLKKNIEETEKRIERRDHLLKQRIKVMYEDGGSISYLQVILGSQNFSNFLDRLMAINLIATQDKRLLDEQKADKKKLEEDKASVEEQLSKLQDQLGSLNELNSKLQEKKKEESRLIQQLQAKEKKIKKDISNEKQAMNEIMSKIAGLIKKREAARKREEEAKRKAEEARKAAEARKRAQEAKAQASSSSSHSSSSSSSSGYSQLSSSGSGLLITPIAPGSYRISSGYGPRWGGFHDGIDFAAAAGTPIRAAASGYVLYAGPASGFGNWIVVDLNNGLINVYGHMYNNGVYVHAGEYIHQGQIIGAVGSNGQSTGYHLHFEVDRAGNFSGESGINPYPYF